MRNYLIIYENKVERMTELPNANVGPHGLRPLFSRHWLHIARVGAVGMVYEVGQGLGACAPYHRVSPKTTCRGGGGGGASPMGPLTGVPFVGCPFFNAIFG